jgi:DNA-binding XRE family transcriptional regulator
VGDNDIGRLLKQRRLELQLTQGYVAKTLGHTSLAILAMENKHSGRLSTAEKVADLLGCDLALVPREGFTPPPPMLRVRGSVQVRKERRMQERLERLERHGLYRYQKAGCRCDVCREASNAHTARGVAAAQIAMQDPNSPRHGHLYSFGCRCDKCTDESRARRGLVRNEG